MGGGTPNALLPVHCSGLLSRLPAQIQWPPCSAWGLKPSAAWACACCPSQPLAGRPWVSSYQCTYRPVITVCTGWHISTGSLALAQRGSLRLSDCRNRPASRAWCQQLLLGVCVRVCVCVCATACMCLSVSASGVFIYVWVGVGGCLCWCVCTCVAVLHASCVAVDSTNACLTASCSFAAQWWIRSPSPIGTYIGWEWKLGMQSLQDLYCATRQVCFMTRATQCCH